MLKTFGRKIITPITEAIITEISTAPAATSFTSLAYGW